MTIIATTTAATAISSKVVFFNTTKAYPKGTSKTAIKSEIASFDAADMIAGIFMTPRWDAIVCGKKVKLTVKVGKKRVLVSARFDWGYQLIQTPGFPPEERYRSRWVLAE